jgi:hypothetical protein
MVIRSSGTSIIITSYASASISEHHCGAGSTIIISIKFFVVVIRNS